MAASNPAKVRLSPRKLAIILLLGFSSGFPLALTGTLLQAWMTDLKIDLGTIGLFSLVGIPYGLKFLWSPLLDRYAPPVFGRRRGWISISQLALVGAIAAIAFSHPEQTPWVTAGVALLISFFSATQDIVVDAYRTEVLETSELGPGAALHVTGYRLAMIASSAFALAAADHWSFPTVYVAMALCMVIGIFATRSLRSPRTPLRPRSL